MKDWAEHCCFSLLFALGWEPAPICLGDISGQAIISGISHTENGEWKGYCLHMWDWILKKKKRNPGNEAPSGMCSLMKLWGDQREQHLDLSEYIDPCTCIRLKRKLQNKTVAWRKNKWNCRIWLKTAGTYPVIPRVSRSKPFIYLSSREATQLWQCLNVNTPRFHLQ